MSKLYYSFNCLVFRVHSILVKGKTNDTSEPNTHPLHGPVGLTYLTMNKCTLMMQCLINYNTFELNFCCVCGRRGCSFSDDLHSPHNLRMLKQHGLEGLSRTELSTLLLQSDNRILPPVSLGRRLFEIMSLIPSSWLGWVHVSLGKPNREG